MGLSRGCMHLVQVSGISPLVNRKTVGKEIQTINQHHMVECEYLVGFSVVTADTGCLEVVSKTNVDDSISLVLV